MIDPKHITDEKGDILYEYQGLFNYKTVSLIWTDCKLKIDDFFAPLKEQKKAMQILIELTQNMAIHPTDKSGFLRIYKQDKHLCIETINAVSVEQKEKLTTLLDKLQTEPEKNIPLLLKDQLQKPMSGHTAGIGLIEVVKYAQKIVYSFFDQNTTYFFKFNVTI